MASKVLNFMEKRQEVIEQKRRNVERIMFDNLLGAYGVIDEAGSIYPVSLVDISYQGCQVQVPAQTGSEMTFAMDKEMTLRFYFTKKSYIPTLVKVKRIFPHQEQDGKKYWRYGLEFDKTVASFTPLQSFIEFLYSYAEHSQVDKGDNKVFFL